MSEAQQFVLRWRGRASGPYSLEEINRKLDDHEIGMGHEIQFQDQWMSLEEFLARPQADVAVKPPVQPATRNPGGSIALAALPGRDLHTQIHSAGDSAPDRSTGAALPVASVAGQGASVATPGTKRRFVYALLALGFGFTGAHNFYARHWMTGLLQLLLSLATMLLGFGIIAPWLWAMVEAFAVRRDGNGLQMT